MSDDNKTAPAAATAMDEPSGSSSPPAAERELAKKKATTQAAFTRTFNSLERLIETATPVSVLETSFNDLKKKYSKLEEVSDELMNILDESDSKLPEISDGLSKRYEQLLDLGSKIAVKKNHVKDATDNTADLIKSFKVSLSLPKPDVQKFNGSSKDYSKFISYLENQIEPAIDDSSQRLAILIDLCSGLAYDAVASLIQCKDVKKAYQDSKQILKELFGSKFQVVRAVLEECYKGPIIKANDLKSLQQLVVSLNNAEITLTENDAAEELVSTDKLLRVYHRLPRFLQQRWTQTVAELQDQGKKPAFKDLRKVVQNFVKSQDNEYAASTSNSNSNPKSSITDKQKQSKPVYSVNASLNVKCAMCHEAHYLNQCDKFKEMVVKDRNDFVLKNRLCRNCLHSGHIASKCMRKGMCKQCSSKHSEMLHDPNFSVKDVSSNSRSQVSSEFTATQSTHSNVGISCVEVFVEGKDAIYKVKAIVDCKSTCNLCTNRLREKLKLPTSDFEIDLNVASGTFDVKGRKINEAKVFAGGMQDYVVARDILAIDSIPMSDQALFTNDDISCCSHLNGIDIPSCSANEIDLLIGSGVPKAFHHLEERKGRDDEIYAVRQVLGWNLVGPKHASDVSKSRSYAQSESTFFINDSCKTQPIRSDIQTVFENDFKDCTLFQDKRGMSVDDKKAHEFVENSCKIVDDQFCVGIPWKESPSNLPSSKQTVTKRLMSLKRKMKNDKSFHKSYSQEMQKYIDKAYLELSDNSDTSLYHYVPHHPVWHPRKGTIRIVWDCALSLNDFIFEGPDLLNSLVDILIRFRRFNYVICSDIRKMYLSVKVPPNDRGALRILWWKDGDYNSDPVEYRATVHMYGAKSSGFVANYCVKRLANEVNDPDVAEVMQKEFYVDDQVSSFENLKDADVIIQGVKDTLKKGGFELTKFISNSHKIMSSIPIEDQIESTDTIFNDAKYQHSVLGVTWEVNSDMLKFPYSIPHDDDAASRRSLLSALAKVFDPLGVIAPVTLTLKASLQETCMFDWDYTDESLSNAWVQFCEIMQMVSGIEVPRCFKHSSFAQVTHISLHGFCDASNKGYAAVVYIRQVDINQNVSVSFVLGKSRVAPKFKGHIPQATIPKLELNAAAVLSVLMNKVKLCIGLNIDEVMYWSDSKAVLSCICSPGKRFPVYWANRLAIIHEHSKDNEWRFVATKQNPADVGSRGIVKKRATEDLSFWIEGPSFLSEDSSCWPEQFKVQPIQEVVLMTQVQVEVGLLDRIIQYYSQLSRLLNVIARILRFMKSPKKEERKSLTCDDLKEAKMALIRYTQKSLDVTKLKKLKPAKDGYGILRANTRLGHAKHLAYDVRFPIILPKSSKSHLTKLIIDHEHKLSAHTGPKHVLTQLRQRFWVINGLKSVKSVISECRKCKEENARPLEQQMSLLPEERFNPSFPFQYVGLDYFGPFMCKLGRKRFKRYGCIFVCLATRAVHLEVVNSLESSAFLCALSRFISRRGVPERIFSDNATNFRGAQEDLKDVIRNNVDENMNAFINARGIQWHFHPPHASHHGGHYERLIRSVRRILRGLTNEQEMNEDNLVTFMCEVEKILNDRPLVSITDDPNDELPLSPSMILLLRGNSCKSLFNESNVPKMYHRQAHYLASIFWKRWTKEYVPSLQSRQKWLKPKRNLKVNDIVMMTDENCVKGHWPLARVVAVYKNDDGMVRKASVKCKSGIKMRPITKLALLEAAE